LIFFISWYSDNYKKLAINESDKKNLIILALAVAFATTMIVSVSQKNLYTGHGSGEKGFYTLNTKTGEVQFYGANYKYEMRGNKKISSQKVE
jgi:hypothetical protein